MLSKIIILVFLVLILASLFSALYLLFRKTEDKASVVRALTLRISLSLALFLLLIAGFYFGVIPGRTAH